jgi:hypothetical protein
MATLGALMSQQLGFTVTTSIGTIYTHALGFTPTVVILTQVGTVAGTSSPAFYTLANTNTITIASANTTANVDVLCGSLHSLIK